jgi:SAM-dependent methyltransferase
MHVSDIPSSIVSESVNAESLPVVIVAITTTRPWLTELSTIRNQQINAHLSIPRCVVVDAFGSYLLPDCVHIDTFSAIQIGHLIANAMHNQIHSNTTCMNLSFLDNNSCSSIIRDCHMTYLEELTKANEIIDRELRQLPKQSNKTILPIFQTNLKAVNFVYGEIYFVSMVHLINLCTKIYVKNSINNNIPRTYVDLGCGSGASLAAIFLCYQFNNIIGIDLMHSKIVTAQALMTNLTNRFVNKSQYSDINIIEMDFLSCSDQWLDADIVYMCSTCFGPDLLIPLGRMLTLLKSGTVIVLLDKLIDAMSSPTSTSEEQCVSVKDLFVLEGSCQCVTTWGEASAFIYRRS